MADSDKKTCFVISPIGEEGSATRERADQVLEYVIKPACEECGYKTVRADEIDEPGIITSQIIRHLEEDPLVIADLTEHNPNVMYELAVRHAVRKPFIQVIETSWSIPFDITANRTIRFDSTNLRSVDAAKKEIIRQIKAIENKSLKIETPISIALDLKVSAQSENEELRNLGELVSAIHSMQGYVLDRLGGIERGLVELSVPSDIELSNIVRHTSSGRVTSKAIARRLNSTGLLIIGAERQIEDLISQLGIKPVAYKQIEGGVAPMYRLSFHTRIDRNTFMQVAISNGLVLVSDESIDLPPVLSFTPPESKDE